MCPSQGDADAVTDADGPDELDADAFERELDAHRLRARPDAIPEGTWGWTPGRVVAVALLVMIVAFWIWAFSPLAPNRHPDELDDPAFANAAGPLCAVAVAELDTVTPAFQAETMADRAGHIDAGTQIYRLLLDRLAAVAPNDTGAGSDGDVVRRWLADYRVYLDDRDRHAAKLRDGIDEPFTTSIKARRQITLPIDEFAKGNRIADCVTPLDL